MDLALLALLGTGGLVLTGTLPLIDPKDFTAPDDTLEERYHAEVRDMSDAGVYWGAVKPQLLNMTNLNESWKPRSAPRQEPTRDVTAIMRDQASQASYLMQYGPQFWFMKKGEMPLATAEQSNPNVEIPNYGESIRGDRHNLLAHYPRVYAEGGNPNIFTGDPGTLAAGEPTEDEEREVPFEGAQNYHFNPFGPGGVFQRLMASENERRGRRRRTDQAVVARPPVGRYLSYKLNARNNHPY